MILEWGLEIRWTIDFSTEVGIPSQPEEFVFQSNVYFGYFLKTSITLHGDKHSLHGSKNSIINT